MTSINITDVKAAKAKRDEAAQAFDEAATAYTNARDALTHLGVRSQKLQRQARECNEAADECARNWRSQLHGELGKVDASVREDRTDEKAHRTQAAEFEELHREMSADFPEAEDLENTAWRSCEYSYKLLCEADINAVVAISAQDLQNTAAGRRFLLALVALRDSFDTEDKTQAYIDATLGRVVVDAGQNVATEYSDEKPGRVPSVPTLPERSPFQNPAMTPARLRRLQKVAAPQQA